MIIIITVEVQHSKLRKMVIWMLMVLRLVGKCGYY